MRRLVIALVLLALAGCAPKYLLVPDFKTAVRPLHHTVAVLPFEVSVIFTDKYGQPVELHPEAYQIKAREIQPQLHEAIIAQLQKYPKQYTVAVQDKSETLRRIHLAYLTDDSIRRISGVRLAKVLGVDAVIRGQYQITTLEDDDDRPRSAPMMIGTPGTGGFMMAGGGGGGGGGQLMASLHDGLNNRLLWERTFRVGGVAAASRALTTYFPYRK